MKKDDAARRKIINDIFFEGLGIQIGKPQTEQSRLFNLLQILPDQGTGMSTQPAAPGTAAPTAPAQPELTPQQQELRTKYSALYGGK
jgi:hypothetical protein